MIAVCYETQELEEKAHVFAERLRVPVFFERAPAEFKLVLFVTPERVGLKENAEQSQGPGAASVDFTSGTLDYRRRFGGKQGGQLLIKAIGGGQKNILDCTAGLGRDSFIMASHGCRVTAVERSEVLAILLGDGLQRAKVDPDVSKICENIKFIYGDSRKILAEAPLVPWDAVYIDPMFPPKKKSALPKKEMQLLQMLLGKSSADAESETVALVEKARLVSPRVVVKRPAGAPPLGGAGSVAVVFKGESTRFDVYLTPP